MTDRFPGRDCIAPVAGRLLQPLQESWRGVRTARYVPAVERALALPADVARWRTLQRLRWLLAWADATVPFWRRRFRAHGFDPRGVRELADLEALPPLTRQDVGQHADELLSTAWCDRPLFEGTSGGTTSAPLVFAQSREAVWWKSATALILRRKLGWSPGDKVALLWGAPEDLPEVAEGRLARWRRALIERLVERTLWLPAGDLDPATLADYVGALRRFGPRVLQGYPSAVDVVARHLLHEGQRLPIPVVLLTAETLFDAQRARIAKAFDAEVFTFYGAREVGWIADECRQEHRLHLNTAGVHLETADDGRLLVTDLVDSAAPSFRYEVGDRGMLSDEPCPCGDPRPVLGELHGRITDVFRLPSGRVVPGVLCDVRNYQIADGVVETQLVQYAKDRIEVRWVAAPTFEPKHLTYLEDWLELRFGGEVELSFTQTDRIEPEPNGKIRYCVSHVPAPEDA